MAELTDKQKRYAVIGAAGLVLLYLLYHYYAQNKASNQASTTGSTGTAAPDTASSDYAALAGQEQGDVAGLQGALNTLTGQEQSDISGLNSTLAGLGGQEQSDISGLTGTVGGLAGQLQNLADLQSSLGNQVAGIAMGQQAVSPAAVGTHKGGAFYNYYVKVTGHPPPATVQTSNFVYQAWKGGVSATGLQAKPTPHPSSKNTHIQHPNGNHAPKTGTSHPNKPAATTAPTAKPKTTPTKPAPPARKPPAKTKAKPSGPRK
jgi:hypothetical protein